MKKQLNVGVYRIEYEIPPKMDHYTAHIAATSHEESIGHLLRVMGVKRIIVISSGIVCPLHDLTPSVRKLIQPPEKVETTNIKDIPVIKEKETKNSEVDVVEEKKSKVKNKKDYTLSTKPKKGLGL